MRKLIKNIMNKIRSRTMRKHYKRLPERKQSQTKNLHFYGSDFGIIEVDAILHITDSHFE